MIAAQLHEVGHYRVERLLGEGGFCTVYEARDLNTGERVALKHLTRVGPQSLSKFKREFRLAQGVHHPSLVELREMFESEGDCFIAMELVEGEDLLSHLRGSQRAANDMLEVVSVFRQLTSALWALHEAGVVHRDVKPRNALVTPRGRAVLLDFGMAKSLGAARSGGAAGTAQYMAPEQAAGSAVGPPADFYALGVCLYEALSGRTPFEGQVPIEALWLKQQQPAPPLGPTSDPLRSQLQALCMGLLELDPARRPGAPEVMRLLGVEGDARSTPAEGGRALDRFAGRDRELHRLSQCLAASGEGRFCLALVEGETGIGKSALVSELVAFALRRSPDALVLRGRCYENEQLAYEAFDGVMEQLVAVLNELAPEARQALWPPHASLLTRLFPAFQVVSGLAATGAQEVPADPAAQRLAAFEALTWLLSAVARTRPLVITIEDLHWADAESFRLLRAMALDPRPPAALLVASVRPRAECSAQACAELGALRAWPCTQTIALEGLAERDARALAERLLGERAELELVSRLVHESRGHPFLLAELARYVQERAMQGDDSTLTLREALRTRIDALGPEAEQVLSVVAVAGRPYAARTVADAAGLDPQELNAYVSELLAQKLLGRRRGHELTCYHEAIRDAAQQRLSDDVRRLMHAQLAAALSQREEADPAELARHHDAAGHPRQAVAAYSRAAEQALSMLAFARAEQLAARGLALQAQCVRADAGVAHALQVLRGHALVGGGRSAEAAAQYLEAARNARGDQRTRLRIWATQNLLMGADIDEGMAAARALLEELGVPIPRSGQSALARTAWDRLCFRLTGPLAEVPVRERSPEQRTQLDALWALSRLIQSVEPALAGSVVARHLRLAFAAGDPAHMARALAEEAFSRHFGDPRGALIDTMLGRARALCEKLGDAALEVHVALREAAVQTVRCERTRALRRLEDAHQLANTKCAGEPALLTDVRTHLGCALASGVQHARLASSMGSWLSEARDRNDRFAISMLEGFGFGHLRHLMNDEPERARDTLGDALRPWPRRSFGFVHYGELVGRVYIGLYEGGDAALSFLEHEQGWHTRAFLLKTQLGKATLLKWRTLACLAARTGGTLRARAELLSEARSLCASLGRLQLGLAPLTHQALRAQLLALDGDLEGAGRVCRAARDLCDRSGDLFFANSLRYLQGRLEGGRTGDEHCQAALSLLTAQGWTQPQRIVSVHCPVVSELGGLP